MAGLTIKALLAIATNHGRRAAEMVRRNDPSLAGAIRWHAELAARAYHAAQKRRRTNA